VYFPVLPEPARLGSHPQLIFASFEYCFDINSNQALDCAESLNGWKSPTAGTLPQGQKQRLKALQSGFVAVRQPARIMCLGQRARKGAIPQPLTHTSCLRVCRISVKSL